MAPKKATAPGEEPPTKKAKTLPQTASIPAAAAGTTAGIPAAAADTTAGIPAAGEVTTAGAADTAVQNTGCATPAPNLPPPGAVDVDSRALMAELAPYVKDALRSYVSRECPPFAAFLDEPAFKIQPLEIKASPGESLSSYKAPWTRPVMQHSVESTGMYEAGGNILWCRVRAQSHDHLVISGSPPPWTDVEEAAAYFEAPAPPRGKSGTTSRVVFPIPVHVYAASIADVDRDHFDGTLDVMCGHVYIYGWYVAMSRAIGKGEAGVSEVASLLQCGLTLTLHLRVGLSVADSFPSFAARAQMVLTKGNPRNPRNRS